MKLKNIFNKIYRYQTQWQQGFKSVGWGFPNNYKLKNAYRVLLTRAREGFIIFVPKGDNSDNTRKCKHYDALWMYLKKINQKQICL